MWEIHNPQGLSPLNISGAIGSTLFCLLITADLVFDYIPFHSFFSNRQWQGCCDQTKAICMWLDPEVLCSKIQITRLDSRPSQYAHCVSVAWIRLACLLSLRFKFFNQALFCFLKICKVVNLTVGGDANCGGWCGIWTWTIQFATGWSSDKGAQCTWSCGDGWVCPGLMCFESSSLDCNRMFILAKEM